MITLQPTLLDDPDNGANGSAEWLAAWESLSGGIPFRHPDWLLTWWRNFRKPSWQAMLLIASDAAGRCVGLLPLVRSGLRSREWRSWGDGNLCSDHLGLFGSGAETDTHAVADAMASFLVEHARDSRIGWDTLLLDGVVAGDAITGRCLISLDQLGATVDLHSRMSVWFKPCLGSWDNFLSHETRRPRQRLRQLLRELDANQDLEHRVATQPADQHAQLDALIELHQRRWRKAGQPGTYADPRMLAFIHEVVTRAGERDRIYLPAIYYREQLVAAEMHLVGDDRRLYCYSSGVDLDQGDLSPGAMLTAQTLRHAHAIGSPGVDYLRGDEVYKSRLQADSTPLLQVRVTAPTLRGRCRRGWFTAEQSLRQSVRHLRGTPGTQTLLLADAFSVDRQSSPCVPTSWVVLDEPLLV